jgi:hypothetical protein
MLARSLDEKLETRFRYILPNDDGGREHLLAAKMQAPF